MGYEGAQVIIGWNMRLRNNLTCNDILVIIGYYVGYKKEEQAKLKPSFEKAKCSTLLWKNWLHRNCKKSEDCEGVFIFNVILVE